MSILVWLIGMLVKNGYTFDEAVNAIQSFRESGLPQPDWDTPVEDYTSATRMMLLWMLLEEEL